MKIFRSYEPDLKRASIQDRLNRELTLAEIFRAQIISIIFVVAALMIFLIMNLYDRFFEHLEDAAGLFYWTTGLIVALALRSYLIYKLFRKKLSQGKAINPYFRYVNSLLEVSIPSIIILIYAPYLDTIYPLLTPIVFVYFIFIILSALELDYKVCLMTGFAAGLEYFLLSMYMLDRPQNPELFVMFNRPLIYFGKSVVLFLAGVTAALVANSVRKRVITALRLSDERNRIERLFGQQISKSIVDTLVESGEKLESKKQKVCVMFLDIKEYTKYCEKKTPEEIVRFQNKVFSFMIESISEHKGIVNQMLGDGIMATFGAPVSYGRDCSDAVDAAIEILDKLDRMNNSGELEGTEIRIGIHNGEAVTGNVGTTERQQYSITGNVVILASRLEQLNKEYNSRLLVSKEVMDDIDKDRYEAEYIGEVVVKGRTSPIRVFRLG